jgi:aminotransferase in exopolysaccharide biosynthesis
MTFDDLITAIRVANDCPEGFLPLHAPVFTGKAREYVLDTIESTFVSSVGEYVSRFEEQLRALTGAAHAVACVNGTAALQVALCLAGVKSGDLVLTQALSFVATANAITHAGGEPLFLDVDTDTLGLSPDRLRSFLEKECENVGGTCLHKASGRRIAACVPMHTFGLPCRIGAICEACAQWGIPVVEDAAEALGSFHNGRHCGTFGLLGTLSFNGNKIVTTGGGGAILTNDPELGQRAKHVTTTAKRPHRWEFYHDEVAWNYRMPNVNAALGCAQLERLDDFVTHKRELAKRYATLFANTPWRFVMEPAGSKSNYWLCSVLFTSRAERNAFLQATNDVGVMTRPAWEPLHILPMYRNCLHDGLAVTLDIADRLVSLPSGVRHG